MLLTLANPLGRLESLCPATQVVATFGSEHRCLRTHFLEPDMNYIPTLPSAIEYFKSAAKQCVKAGHGSHVEMLDEAARAFG